MGWSVGSDKGRDIGYGVPATCDHPGCGAAIDRGLSYVCGGEPFGGDQGCGLFFCGSHLYSERRGPFRCIRCTTSKAPFDPTPDTPEWINHKLTDPSWAEWRGENPAAVAALAAQQKEIRHA